MAGYFGTIVLVLAVGGCTYKDAVQAPTSGAAASGSVSTPEAAPTAEFVIPAQLPAPIDVGANEDQIAELGSQTRGANIGPLTLGSTTVVYVRCAGGGSLTFELDGVGRSVLPCEAVAEPRGTRNVFDTRLAPQTTATVESSPGQIWSLGVYSEPTP
ncbi:hypothetical protein [Arthrobacter sp. PAMC25284]|uniref:hypothetical protein n=1 Tax=Arthrobacter sp. PAMC25284 TaxID=2861279 RepID=UPI001C625E70|nr:hypothetical protein [Arthrobacter sp. PAMC25284]QYF91111.1 hypothetical protein KY499_07965 [Arthrobacter sp. PAMC25284]